MRRRGQSLVEMALVLPLITILMLGATDMGRAFYLNIEISGASRSGMRAGIVGEVTDVGKAVRSEPNNSIPNDGATWGDTGPGGINDCNPLATGHKCGDPQGCPPSVFTGGRAACFAVRICNLADPGVCGGTPSPWGTRPVAGSNAAIQVHLVYRLVPVTPAVAALATGTSGIFYLSSDTIGVEMY